MKYSRPGIIDLRSEEIENEWWNIGIMSEAEGLYMINDFGEIQL